MENSSKKWNEENRDCPIMENVAATPWRRNCSQQSGDSVAQLEEELRRAYLKKELEAQILEREAKRCAERKREEHATEVLLLSEQLAKRTYELERKFDVAKRSEEYRKHLEEQMRLKEQQKIALYEEERLEREVLMEVDKVTDERERLRKLERKCEMAASVREENLILLELKAIREEIEHEEEEKWLREELEYALTIEERAEELERLRKNNVERKERMLQEVSKIIVDANMQREERRAILVELMYNEVTRELAIREKEERMKRKETREKLQTDLEAQIIFNGECKLRFLEQDRLFAEDLMGKILEGERIARLTAEARRRLQLQYRRDLEELIEERRRIREQEILRIEEAMREEKRLEEMRVERMREERLKLLAKHAPNVAGLLRRAALTEEERAIISWLQEANRPIKDAGNNHDANIK